MSARAAVLEGSVADDRTGRPLARASVAVRPIQGVFDVPTKSVYTDSYGRFTLSSLPAGAYLVSARKTGFADAAYGQKSWDEPGTPIILQEEGRFVAEFRLKRLAVITGEILDENGLGFARHRVLAYRAEQPPRLAASGVSDDRGVFRVADLEPGLYYVRTAPKELEDGTGLLPTYFGQTTTLQGAKPVEARLNAETADLRIMPLQGRLFRLTGTAAWPGLRSIALYSDIGKRDAAVDLKGRFQFDQLVPGRFDLLAEATSGEPPLVAHRTLLLSDDTEVVLEPSMAPSLEIQCEDRDGRAMDTRQVSVFVNRTDPPGAEATRRGLCGERIWLAPGGWKLAVASPQHLYVASVLEDRRPSDPVGFRLMPGQSSELRVLFSTRPASLRGKVVAPDGNPVVGASVILNPLDDDVKARLYGRSAVHVGPNGEYRFYGLPPGRYQVIGSLKSETSEDVDWRSVRAETILLEEGTDANLDVEITGAP